jgi:hypothetical protein
MLIGSRPCLKIGKSQPSPIVKRGPTSRPHNSTHTANNVLYASHAAERDLRPMLYIYGHPHNNEWNKPENVGESLLQKY